jgi:hypothetical protein
LLKVGIGGADGLNKAWTPQREEKTKETITKILLGTPNLKTSQLAINFIQHKLKDEIIEATNALSSLDDYVTKRIKEVTLVSGHCPVGWCTHCQKRVLVSNEALLSGFTTCPYCGYLTVKRAGGVDIWAEEIASKLGIQIELHSAEHKGWNDAVKCESCGFTSESFQKFRQHWTPDHSRTYIILKGYRSRNLDMARVCDYWWDIEPKGSCRHCDGNGGKQVFDVNDGYRGRWHECTYCHGTGNHSGASFVMKEAKKLGKKVFQIVIE